MKILYPPLVSWGILPQSPHAYMDIFSKNGFDCYFMDSNHPSTDIHTHKPFKAQKNLTVLPPDYDVGAIDPEIIFYSFPAHINLVNNYHPDFVLFVMYDYHGDEYLEPLRKSIAIADIVVAISQNLYNLALQLGCEKSKLIYVPNGVYYQDFTKRYKRPKELKGLARPILGYSGVISEEWINIPLLNKVAEEHTVVCTGSVFDGELSDNIINLGHIPKEDFPNFVRSFDVGLLPFNHNKFSQHMDPLKFYQYCAAGIPIVSTNIPAVFNSGKAYCTPDEEHFIDFIKLALSEKGKIKNRKEYAKNHDWNILLQPLVEKLKKLEDGDRHGNVDAKNIRSSKVSRRYQPKFYV